MREEKFDIHHSSRKLKNAVRYLNACSDICTENKRKILEFQAWLGANGFSPLRQVFYIQHLTWIARMLRKPFDRCTKQNLLELRPAVDSAMGQLFLNRTVVSDRSNTNPKDYLSRLREDWALVQIFVHGGSTQHEFYMNNVQKEGTVTWSDIRGTDPHGFFYVLSSCWTGRYIEPNHIAGRYVFAKTYGLAAIAPTKPGDMQEFQKFYSTLRNENLGTAFRDWLADRIRNEESGNTYTSKYFYSFTILGDPTLFALPSKYPKAQYATVTTSNTPTSSSYTTVSKTDAALTTYKTTSGSAVTEQIPSETRTTLGIVATAFAVAVLMP